MWPGFLFAGESWKPLWCFSLHVGDAEAQLPKLCSYRHRQSHLLLPKPGHGERCVVPYNPISSICWNAVSCLDVVFLYIYIYILDASVKGVGFYCRHILVVLVLVHLALQPLPALFLSKDRAPLSLHFPPPPPRAHTRCTQTYTLSSPPMHNIPVLHEHHWGHSKLGVRGYCIRGACAQHLQHRS